MGLYDLAIIDESSDALFNLAIILIAVMISNNARYRPRLLRRAIVHPKFSAWVRFYCHADDRSFLTMTAFTKNAFNKLERAVFPPDAARIKSVGRPELIDNRGKVGLYLFLQLRMIQNREPTFTNCIGFIDGFS